MADKARRLRHERDHWVRQARSEGYRSRAVYKLREIDRRDKLFKQGMKVLDIGAAPGGWCQYAVAQVGASGTVVGVDTEPVEPLPGALFVRGDVREEAAARSCLSQLGGACDLAICDIAPHITGIASSDQARMQELLEAALGLTEEALCHGGQALFKVFSGQAESCFRPLLGRRFASVRARKPDASRRRSSEFYLLCREYKGREEADAVL